MYHGDRRLGDTIDIKFVTASLIGTLATLGGAPAVAAYPANSVTEITAGITLTTNFDGRTGSNHVRIVASGANGYLTATDYTLVITAGTIGGISAVGRIVGSFSIENRSALMPTVAGRTIAVDAAGLVDIIQAAADKVWGSAIRTLIGPVTLTNVQGVQKNTALNNFTFVMFDASGNPLPGLTVAARRVIDGGAFAAATNSPAEISDGAYKINLAAADLNGDTILLEFTATGARTTLVTIKTVLP